MAAVTMPLVYRIKASLPNLVCTAGITHASSVLLVKIINSSTYRQANLPPTVVSCEDQDRHSLYVPV